MNEFKRKRINTTCKQNRRLVYEYMDNSLPGEIKDTFDHHLKHCGDCKIHYESEVRFSKLLQKSLAYRTKKLKNSFSAINLQEPHPKNKSLKSPLLFPFNRLRAPVPLSLIILFFITLLSVVYFVFLAPESNLDEQWYLLLHVKANQFNGNPVDNWIEHRLQIVVMDHSKGNEIRRIIYPSPRSQNKQNPNFGIKNHKNNGG